MSDFNPYAPPSAVVADILPQGGPAYQKVKVFSTKGRMGRLKYVIYVFGGFMWMVAAAMVAGMAMPILGEAVCMLGLFLSCTAYLAFHIMLGIQRCHDMNMSGWLSVATLIPPIVLAWMVISGTPRKNRFGPPPFPNTLKEKISGAIASFVTVGALISVGISFSNIGTPRTHTTEGQR